MRCTDCHAPQQANWRYQSLCPDCFVAYKNNSTPEDPAKFDENLKPIQ